METESIKLGDRVQDRISKLEGIVVGITDWLYGCRRLSVQPETAKDNKPADNFVIDDPQAILLKKDAVTTAASADDNPPAPGPHGDRPDPLTRLDPTRG